MISAEKLHEVNRLREEIDHHGKLPIETLKKVNYKLRLEWNYTSNSMEGNTLTRDETRSVMVGNIDVQGKPIKDLLEMKGHDDVISKIIEIGKGELNLSEARIREIHKGIMHEEDVSKAKMIGVWKTKHNQIINHKGEKFDFTPPTEVPDRMHELINWLNSEKEKIDRADKTALHPADIAFKFHLDYVSIHPFYDGNGRTARIFTNLILIAYGYPPVYIKISEKDVYGNYLGDIQGYGGNPDLFYDFMAGLLIRSLQLALDAINGKSIEDPDDVDKEIELLKRELKLKAGSGDIENRGIRKESFFNTILPLFEEAAKELSQFNEMFIKGHWSILVKGFPMDIPIQFVITELYKNYLLTNLTNQYLINSTQFKYLLEGFKYGEKKSNSLTCILNMTFDEEGYSINIIERGYLHPGRTWIKKKYSEILMEIEKKQLINELKKEVLQAIKEFS